LGAGAYAAATTGADDGGPLTRYTPSKFIYKTINQYITDIGAEGPWYAGASLTIVGLSGDKLVVWADSVNAPTITGSATVEAVATAGSVWLVTWTADGTVVIANTP
jgi:hypothetical protein